MPGREIFLATGQIYHIINRGILGQPVFNSKKAFSRAIELLRFYQNKKPPLSYSRFIFLSPERRQKILENFRKEKNFLVEIVAFCLMPSHFHLMIKQIKNGGVSNFVAKFTNSYTRYFNVKNERRGPIFEGKFKAIRVESDEQLMHLSRYIHLNPYSGLIIKKLDDLINYPYSSLPEYLGIGKSPICEKKIVLELFKNTSSYKKFVFDQADYQKNLQEIKYLSLESKPNFL